MGEGTGGGTDDTAAATGAARPSGPVTYSERLHVPWWWYPVALLVAALLAGEVHLAGWKLTAWLPFVLFLPIAVLATWSLGRARVEVVAGELRVRDARLPLSVIQSVIPLDAQTLTRAVGRHGNPSAFVFVRAFSQGGVQIILDDPDDPTPYWIISTRHRQQLAAVLGDGR